MGADPARAAKILSCLPSLLLSAVLCAAASSPAAAREQANSELVTEGIPASSPELRAKVKANGEGRSALFLDWLDDGSMLISTRFGEAAQVHRVTEPGGQRTQLTFSGEPIRRAVGQPKSGGRFVFLRDEGGGEYDQGYVMGLTGPETRLTRGNTRNQDFVFARDGGKLAWSEVEAGAGDYSIVVATLGDGAFSPTTHRYKGAAYPLAFSSDGSKLLVERHVSAQSSGLDVLEVATGARIEAAAADAQVSYAGGAFLADGASVLTITDRGAELARLVRLDVGSGEIAVVLDGGAWPVDRFDLSPDGRTVAATINEGGRSRLVMVDAKNGRRLKSPPLPVGEIERVKFSPDGRRLAINLNRATSPLDVWVWDLAEAALTRWTTSEMGGLDPTSMVDPQRVEIASFDGLKVSAWVYKPPTPGRKPVIINIHGGPEGQHRPGFTPAFQYYVNELGAVVIAPDVRGSTGYGKTYLSLDNGIKRHDAVRDIGAILDWVASQPDLDPDRVAVAGISYGGYMALAALATYGDRLAGGVSVAGISNWLTFLETTEGYRRDLRRVEYGDERVPEVRRFLEQDSPLHKVDAISRPVLVVAGFNDPRVRWTEGRQLVDALRSRGREAWWMLAKDEGHGFRKKSNVDALREAETLFFQRLFEPKPGR